MLNTDTTSTWHMFVTNKNIVVTGGEQMTFSFDAKIISDLSKFNERLVIIRFYDTITDDHSDAGSFSKIHLGIDQFSKINAQNKWFTVSKTFTVPTNAKRMCIGFHASKDGEAKFRGLKL